MSERHALSEEQKTFYSENGFLIDLEPVFTPEEISALNVGLGELVKLLEPGEKHMAIREWHMSSKWLYDVCTHPRILDYVEGILGPNFFMWGSQFFAKAPASKDTVAWHQDAYYWPLHPHNSVTVWLAFTDVDEENGAMKVIPRSHKAGLIKHRTITGDSVLALELEHGTFNESEQRSLVMKAGQLSLHDDAIVHGSPANTSNRWRNGLTIRYSGNDVKCDLSRSPNFKAYQVRGTDGFKHNPQGEIPTETFARLSPDYHISSTDEIKK
ncbi:phytanoyl-CoA dioxygenase family protein [Paenibacillus sacheonensis]|uniref:Phytanoyl-CoA dioxygenase family protein n=1 Tax=Paenibacillus sacheonensis TaxID=742054 RepID=A0A7X5BXD9_9BACL|nr:phytanoyl-CoA dioxygenase family protein [Paenibacillus sacheonensis]MBM7563155.1 ectoine hydroxylase-related dioxygenase (phytanoyl-CoA dioxygenase family) [Paenibacillus sacheonensis]NBC68281.1 phytanoyl-CoA dioxygenase family protein [Paenibacillus sacheonensis]